MTAIIAGRFDNITKAEAAVRDLLANRCPEEDISTFHNNAPGQHGTFPVGGDEDADPGAKEAHGAAVKAAAVGAGIGLAAAVAGPLAAVAAAGVGAYTGSLSGVLQGTGDEHSVHERRRPAGVMVAVNMSHAVEDEVVKALRAHGAEEVEKAEGEWRNGEWVDFDPLSSPQLLSDGKLSTSERAVRFMVSPTVAETWCVYETGFSEPLSEFNTKADAVKYAIALAQTKSQALVQVYNDDGNVEETIDPTIN